jgi:hypothetical protein
MSLSELLVEALLQLRFVDEVNDRADDRACRGLALQDIAVGSVEHAGVVQCVGVVQVALLEEVVARFLLDNSYEEALRTERDE